MIFQAVLLFSLRQPSDTILVIKPPSYGRFLVIISVANLIHIFCL